MQVSLVSTHLYENDYPNIIVVTFITQTNELITNKSMQPW